MYRGVLEDLYRGGSNPGGSKFTRTPVLTMNMGRFEHLACLQNLFLLLKLILAFQFRKIDCED